MLIYFALYFFLSGLLSTWCYLPQRLDVVVDEGDAVDGLERRFQAACPSGATDILVDVVAGGGTRWYKATARNHRALHKVWLGQCKYGQRSIASNHYCLPALVYGCGERETRPLIFLLFLFNVVVLPSFPLRLYFPSPLPRALAGSTAARNSASLRRSAKHTGTHI